MKERPILFSAPMVRAILAGTKTMTRRIVKPQSTTTETPYLRPDGLYVYTVCRGHAVSAPFPCPYGKSGDRLWVRETFTLCESIRTDGNRAPLYRATSIVAEHKTVKWKPSIFMPRWASRITLEVTGVRVERLNAINGCDAIAEGIESETDDGITTFKDYLTSEASGRAATQSYRTLWESINGLGSWDANPWVWVVEFNRMQKEDA